MTSGWGALAFVVALVVGVVLHELGHLVTAKRAGMRADRFFVGFGPTLWSRRVGETEYGLKLLPLGGFVRVMGMSPADERQPSVGVAVVRALEPPAEEEQDRADDARDGASVAASPVATAPAASALVDDEVTVAAALEDELVRRGTPRETRAAIAAALRARTAAGPGAALAERIDGAIAAAVPAPERVGDLAWRLLRGDDGRFFPDRPAFARAVVLATGPLTHLVVAFAVLAAGYATLEQPTGELAPIVGQVVTDSPAEAAGLAVGDRIVAVADVASDEFVALREELRSRPGRATTLLVERAGEQVEITLVPRAVVDEETGRTVGLAGFVPAPEFAPLGTGEALGRAAVGEPGPLSFGGVVPMLTGSADALVRILSPTGLGGLVSQATGAEARDPEGAVSLVGAAAVAGQLVEAGPYGAMAFLALLAGVNVFLALFNLVPLPPFDGGHLAVLAIERATNAVRRRRGLADDWSVDPRTTSAVAAPVLAVLAILLVTTLWLDITEPIRLG